MGIKHILLSLMHTKQINSISMPIDIVQNIRRMNKMQLIQILQILQNTSDVEIQAQLLSILSAYLLFNGTNRDVIVKWNSIYDTMYIIISRGLPMKSAIALNFITTMVYDEGDDALSRNRTLSLYAQRMIRSSGCLTAMIHLFANYMLYTDTWKALCRCLAEVCRGSEANQTSCSHLIPLCIQKCLQENIDVFLLLQNVLCNHKRNTQLFHEADGMKVFYRENLLQNELCLQLLHIVVQNTPVENPELIRSHKQVLQNLHNTLKFHGPNPQIGQWTTVILYHLESRIKSNDSYSRNSRIEVMRNEADEKELNDHNSAMNITNIDDTPILFQHIMQEILSDQKPAKITNNAGFRYNNIPKEISILNNLVHDSVNKKIEANKMYSKTVNPARKSFKPCNELSFSFLMGENSLCSEYEDAHGFKKQNIMCKEGHLTSNSESVNNGTLVEKQFNATSNYFENNNNGGLIEFKPTFASTPKKEFMLQKHSFSIHESKSMTHSFTKFNNKSNGEGLKVTMKHKTCKRISKDSQRQKSMSSRILDAINESCTTFIKTVKNVFTTKKTNTSLKDTENIPSSSSFKEKTNCSYSFTNYMQKRDNFTRMRSLNTKQFYSSGMDTINFCQTCNDTGLLKKKLGNDDYLKETIKKLKLGINLYGCDFKLEGCGSRHTEYLPNFALRNPHIERNYEFCVGYGCHGLQWSDQKISKNMWPRENYMTSSVLYNLYRKLIVK